MWLKSKLLRRNNFTSRVVNTMLNILYLRNNSQSYTISKALMHVCTLMFVLYKHE